MEGILRLAIHQDKIYLKSVASGIDFLGWVNFPHHRILRRTTKHRMFRRLRQHPQESTLQTYLGLLSHGATHKVRQQVLNESYLWNV